MKKYIKSIITATVLLMLVSCDSFLDLDPKSDSTFDPLVDGGVKSKYTSITDAQSALNGAYTSYKTNTFQFEIFGYNDIQSDNCYHGGDGIPGEEEDAIRLTTMNSKTALMWTEYFAMIGAATDLIENTRIMTSGIDGASRNKIMAEGKFIRSYAYFDAVRIWGDIPLMTQLIPSITAENMEELYPLYYPARTPSDSIYKQIIDDLDSAIPYLNSESKGAFKATKGAAYGLLAKIYATKGAKSSRDYNQVVKYCDLVIAEGYNLVTTYDNLFSSTTKYTSESIFEVAYDITSPNWAYWVLYSEEDGSITWRRYCTPTHDLLKKYSANDVRYASTVVFKEVPYDTHYPSSSYAIANKIRTKDSNIILMRLADILLLKAEALVELNKVAEAMNIVNSIRERAGIATLSTTLSQDNARLAIENERQLELALEGHRWFDLLRNDRMEAVMQQHRDKNGKLLFQNIQEFRRLWPIPQGEKDINSSLTQNPGY